MGGVAEQGVVGAALAQVDESVAAFEDAEGAEGFQLRGGPVEAGMRSLEGEGMRCPKALLKGLGAVAVVREAEGGVLAAESSFELGHALVLAIEGAVEGRFGAVGKVINVLGSALEGGKCAAEDGVGIEGGESLTQAKQVVATGTVEASLEAVQPVGDAVLGVGEEFGGRGGSGGVEVGGCVGDGGVGGVADAGDDGDRTGGDRAGDNLRVKAVEVFPGAAATGYEDDVGVVGVRGKPVDAGGDFGRAVGTLDGRRIDKEIDGGMAAATDLDDVAEGGALQAGDDSNAVGEGWEGALAVEEAFAAEAFFEGLSGGEECAEAGLLHGLRDELELAPGFVHGE